MTSSRVIGTSASARSAAASGGVGAPVEVGEGPHVLERVPGRKSCNVVADEDEARVDEGAHPQHELGRRSVVDGDDDDAGEEAAPVADHPLRAVLAPEHDLVALGEAGRGELCRERRARRRPTSS